MDMICMYFEPLQTYSQELPLGANNCPCPYPIAGVFYPRWQILPLGANAFTWRILSVGVNLPPRGKFAPRGKLMHINGVLEMGQGYIKV